MVSETAGPSQLALAASYASSSPRAVFFPYRYMEGAIHYNEMFPDVELYLLGGRNSASEINNEFIFVQSHTELDLYRAALSSFYLADGKDILLMSGEAIPDSYKAIFNLAIEENSYTGSVSYIENEDQLTTIADFGCIILLGFSTSLLIEDLSIPLILFSWINPEFTPRSLRIIFDDSPWAIARDVLNSSASAGEEILIPSFPLLLINRMEKFTDFFEFSQLLKEKF